MSLLSVIQDAAPLAGIERPTSVMANTDLTVQQLAVYCRVVGETLARKFDWRGLVITGETVTGTGAATTFSLPSGFHRFVKGTPLFYADAPTKIVRGPIPDDEWTLYQTGVFPFADNIFRLRATYLEIYPALANGDEVTYDYVTDQWISNAAGTSRYSVFAADTDLFHIPERLLILGTALNFRAFKGLDTTALEERYDEALWQEASVTRGMGRIYMGGGQPQRAVRRNMVRVTP